MTRSQRRLYLLSPCSPHEEHAARGPCYKWGNRGTKRLYEFSLGIWTREVQLQSVPPSQPHIHLKLVVLENQWSSYFLSCTTIKCSFVHINMPAAHGFHSLFWHFFIFIHQEPPEAQGEKKCSSTAPFSGRKRFPQSSILAPHWPEVGQSPSITKGWDPVIGLHLHPSFVGPSAK